MASDRPIVIFYEHPDWFRPLVNKLDVRREKGARR
jgi:hypothetical protein